MLKATHAPANLFVNWRPVFLLLVGGIMVLLAHGHQCLAQQSPAPGAEQSLTAPLDSLRAADRAVSNAFSALQKRLKAARQKGDARDRDLDRLEHEVDFLAPFVDGGDLRSMRFFLKEDFDDLAKFPDLKEAKAKLRSALVEHEAVYVAQLPVAFERLVEAVTKLCREQGSAQRISAVLANFAAYEQLPKRIDSGKINHRYYDLLIRYLGGFKSFVAAQTRSDLPALAEANFSLDDIRLLARSPFPLEELEQYRSHVITRLREQNAGKLKRIIETLPSLTTVDDVNPVIASLEECAATEETLTGRRAEKWDEKYEKALSFLRQWRLLVSFESDGRWTEAAEVAQELQNQFQGGDPKLVEVAKARADLAVANEQKARGAELTAFCDTVPGHLESISSPSGLLELATSIALLLEEGAPVEPSARWLADLQRELQQIAPAWQVVEVDPVFAARVMLATSAATHPWSEKLARLRERVARQAIVSYYGFSELEKPPMKELPLTRSFEQLVADAAGASQWDRVYELLRVRAALLQTSSNPQKTAAVKAYLTGINFEKAELFVDAVQSYTAVLAHVSGNVPSKDAAERIKAIRATHPHLFPSVSQ